MIPDLQERKNRKKRTNGFAFPRSWEQIAFIVLYLFTIISEVAILCLYEKGVDREGKLVVHCVLSAVVLGLWVLVSVINPECSETDPPYFQSYNLFGQAVERSNLFCVQCNKKILGMDHHCTFLNTCIGAKNYLAFIFLLVVVACQLLLNISEASLMNCDGKDESSSVKIRAFVGCLVGVSFLLVLFVIALLGLHFFLNFIAKKGTFNWVLYQREKRFAMGNVHVSEDNSPNIMEEVSASFSSHMFRSSRNRAYLPSLHPAFSRDSAISAEESVQAATVDDSLAQDQFNPEGHHDAEGKGRSRLHRSELLKMKAAKGTAVHPYDGEQSSNLQSQTLPRGSDMPTVSLANPSTHTFALHGTDTV